MKPILIPLPPLTDEEALARFKGKRTEATLEAMRRLKAAPRFVTIPAHLAQKFWRLTGGWKELKPQSVSDYSKLEMEPCNKGLLRCIRLGDLRVVLYRSYASSSYTQFFLVYRSAVMYLGYDQKTWAKPEAVQHAWNHLAQHLTFDEAKRLNLPCKDPPPPPEPPKSE